MASYRVKAPYVTTAVLDANGAEVTLGFYEGGVIEDPVEGEHLDKLLRAGYIEKGSVPFGSGAAEDGAPAKSAPKADWEEFARSQGATDEDLDGATKEDLVAKYGD